MVEAPGTAPGSDRFIALAVYRHSRVTPALRNIGICDGEEKPPAKLCQGFFPEIQPDFAGE